VAAPGTAAGRGAACRVLRTIQRRLAGGAARGDGARTQRGLAVITRAGRRRRYRAVMAAVPGWLVAVHDAATTLSPTRDLVIAYDLEGRPTSWFQAGSTYKRSLASHVFGRRTEAGARRRWSVPGPRARALLARALEVAADAAAAAARGESLAPGADDVLQARLRCIARWTPEALLAERERFLAAYAPISILPPDQYGSVVLQATFGCSWNRCTYCTFYQGRPFEVRPPSVFEAHVAAVQRLLGRAAAGRRSIFLADGNALVLSNDRLRPVFAAAREAFPGRSLAGFVDVFGGERKPVDGWRELRGLGLRSVAVGVETGHDPLLAYLDKPGSADAAADFVDVLKRADVQVSVILMVGVGGRRFAAGHERDTVTLLGRLHLGAGDTVYLSPFVRHGDSAYAARAARDGLDDLGETERRRQEQVLREAARAALPAARVARYHIDEFVY
jgi:hypothetical protein